jgi:tRNA1(Val) A37 N6-methylase TrmN6
VAISGGVWVAAGGAEASHVRIIDPCCGEGSALHHTTEYLSHFGCAVEAFGIEIDQERALRAREVLNCFESRVAHADMQDVITPRAAFSFLLLNPPYGDMMGSSCLDDKVERDRHEKLFCRQWFSMLAIGGVVALVIPYYVLDEDLATLIARHFERITVFKAFEQQFRQVVVMGVKRRPAHAPVDLVKSLVALNAGADPVLEWGDAQHYVVPATPSAEFSFTMVRIEPQQLAYDIASRLHQSTMWPRLRHIFRSSQIQPARRPLCALSSWHLALSLAAGQISGLIRQDDRMMLVKGATFKKKVVHQEYEQLESGDVRQTTISTDRFIPVIKAIDLTPASEHFGCVVTIA